jgi:hypothetical protein
MTSAAGGKETWIRSLYNYYSVNGKNCVNFESIETNNGIIRYYIGGLYTDYP